MKTSDPEGENERMKAEIRSLEEEVQDLGWKVDDLEYQVAEADGRISSAYAIIEHDVKALRDQSWTTPVGMSGYEAWERVCDEIIAIVQKHKP